MKLELGFFGSSTVLALLLLACSKSETSTPNADSTTASRQENAQQLFWDGIAKHCGSAFAGNMVSTDKADADMANEKLVMTVSTCAANQIRIPFHVGDNRSRTWVLSKTRGGLRLKHDHRHEDGSEDAVTQYGGDTVALGSATRQEFPVDAESIALFKNEGLAASVTNSWTLEVDDKVFAYELRREGRLFRVEFDLTQSIETPPPAWGS